MKRPETIGQEQKSSTTIASCPLLAKYPLIFEYLTTTVWEDSTPRQPSKLSVSVEDGNVLIALNDVDLKQSMYTSSSSLGDAMKLLEGALKASSGSWRPWKDGRKRK